MVWANLIVATGHNNLAISRSVEQVSRYFVKGNRLEEGMLNRVSAVVRAYDPCLSCSTHAGGVLPLRIELVGPAGEKLDEVSSEADEAAGHRLRQPAARRRCGGAERRRERLARARIRRAGGAPTCCRSWRSGSPRRARCSSWMPMPRWRREKWPSSRWRSAAPSRTFEHHAIPAGAAAAGARGLRRAAGGLADPHGRRGFRFRRRGIAGGGAGGRARGCGGGELGRRTRSQPLKPGRADHRF